MTLKFVYIVDKSNSIFSKELRLTAIGMGESLSGNQNDQISLADGKDGRSEAPVRVFDNKQKNQIYNMVLLRMKFGKKVYNGTGTIIYRGNVSNTIFILTCTHNVVSINNDLDEKDQMVKAQNIEFVITQNTKFRWKELKCYKALDWYYHPKYAENPTSSSGNDIAIIKANIDGNDKLLKNIKRIRVRAFESEITAYSGAKVIGYPGEKDGELWGMTGDYNLNDKNTLISYRNIDTTAGQSGSPIFDYIESKSDDTFTRLNEIIGVHTGGKIDQNWGTALNNDKLEWIRSIIPGYFWKYEPEKIRPYTNGAKDIMKCIGIIQTDFYGKHPISDTFFFRESTGTVFSINGKYAYIITSARAVVQEDDEGDKKYPLEIRFVRQVSNSEERIAYPGGVIAYPAEIIAIHHKYVFKHNDQNDLAIIRFKDIDHFYHNLFIKNSLDIDLFCSDDIDDEESGIIYNLYGYPTRSDINSKENYGELYGMRAPSFGIKHEMELYVKKNRKGTKFIYNAIEISQGGFDGAALFIDRVDGKFKIVGVHTDTGSQQNYGVALNRDKITWLNQSIRNSPMVSK